MLTAMARDSEVAVYVCNLLAANYSIANEELRDDHLATWSNIFGALRDYYEGFRTNMVPAMEAIRTCPQRAVGYAISYRTNLRVFFAIDTSHYMA